MVGTKGRSNQNLINTNKQHKKTKTKKEKKREKRKKSRVLPYSSACNKLPNNI